MNREFYAAHMQSDSDWLSYIGMPMLYDLCMCVCRDEADVRYVKLHKPRLEI